MPLFDAGTIARFTNNAEDIFATEFPCIVGRYAIPIVSGTSLYTLPDYVLDIKRVTYRGIEINPSSHRDFRTHQPAVSAQSVPTEYIYNNVGKQVIKLFPAPTENITEDQTNLFGSNILTQCIVEFFRLPDYTTYTIPTFFRRRLLKEYVSYRCYAIDGKGYDKKLSAYHQKKWEALKAMYGEALYDLINKPRKLVAGSEQYEFRTLPRPVLPASMRGTGVDVGE